MPSEDQQKIAAILATYEPQGIQFHAMRTRVSGSRRFVTFHVLIPGAWTVQQGHCLCEEIELAIIQALPETHVVTHLEPIEDPSWWTDQNLDRM